MTTRLHEETTVKIDKELQRQVIDELSWDPAVDATAIGVSVDSGVIVLSGTVRSLSEKWAAERAAERVRGVKAISDEIVVEPSGDFRRDDQDIARAAINALDWNASVPQGRIQVILQTAGSLSTARWMVIFKRPRQREWSVACSGLGASSIELL
jgi:hypothetical protein